MHNRTRRPLLFLILPLLSLLATGCCTAYEVELELQPSTQNEALTIDVMLLHEAEVKTLKFLDSPGASDKELSEMISAWFQASRPEEKKLRDALEAEKRLVEYAGVSLPMSDADAKSRKKLARLPKITSKKDMFLALVVYFPTAKDAAQHFSKKRVGDSCSYKWLVAENSVRLVAAGN